MKINSLLQIPLAHSLKACFAHMFMPMCGFQTLLPLRHCSVPCGGFSPVASPDSLDTNSHPRTRDAVLPQTGQIVSGVGQPPR